MAVPTYGELFMDLMSALASSGRMKDLNNHINHGQTEESMFDWIWGLPEAHTCLIPMQKKATKSEYIVEELRKNGLELFTKGENRKALELYNKCLMLAPHPKCIESNSDETSDSETENIITSNYTSELKTLANIYKNRSAVLYNLKEYEKCILDINRVLSYLNPNCIDDNILEIKIKSLIRLNCYAEAQSISPKLFDKLSKDDRDFNIKSIEKLSINGPVKYTLAKYRDLMFAYQTPDPPKVLECNKGIPSFSDALDLKFSPENGRYAIAARDIKPGEVLVVEASQVSCPNSEFKNLQSHCCYCLKRCHVPIPCPNCDTVVFCDEKCRSTAQVNFHNVECEILPTLFSLDMDNNAVLTLRLVLKSTFIKLRQCVPHIKQEILTKDSQIFGFDSSEIYNSSEYSTVYHLVGNNKYRNTLELLQTCTKAFIITKLLLNKTEFFVNEANECYEPSTQDVIFLGSTILHHLLTFPYNCFSITEVQMNINNPKINYVKNIGSGIYPSASLLNHSCDASTVRCNFGNVLVMYAKKYIQAGEEVSDNYGYSYPALPKETRVSELSLNYKFECTCNACENNWEIMERMATNSKLKGNMTISANENYHTNNNHEDELIRYQKLLYEINSSEVNECDSDKYISMLVEIIEFMNKYVELPCKDFLLAQMLLTHFLQMGASSLYFE